MSFLKSLLGTTDEPEPAIKPTRLDALDTQVIPLMILVALGIDDSRGHHNMFRINLYTYLAEERLETYDIPVNRYNWCSKPYDGLGGREYPHSEQLIADVERGFQNNSSSKPVFDISESCMGTKTTYRRPNGYTDLYIALYFEHSTVERRVVEQHVNAILDEWRDYSNHQIHDPLTEQYAPFST